MHVKHIHEQIGQRMMQQYKILVVDDDSDIVNAIQTILSMSGYTVVTAETGQQCLQTAHAEMPDLILLDLMLPDMHGTMVAKHLRQSGNGLCNIPIVVISAAHEAKQIAQSMDAKACIEKPFELHELLTTVANHVQSPEKSDQPSS